MKCDISYTVLLCRNITNPIYTEVGLTIGTFERNIRKYYTLIHSVVKLVTSKPYDVGT